MAIHPIIVLKSDSRWRVCWLSRRWRTAPPPHTADAALPGVAPLRPRVSRAAAWGRASGRGRCQMPRSAGRAHPRRGGDLQELDSQVWNADMGNQCCQLAEMSAAKHKSGPIKISAAGQIRGRIFYKFCKKWQKRGRTFFVNTKG
jgi:hypothetical protein